jgi:hypothetical protein
VCLNTVKVISKYLRVVLYVCEMLSVVLGRKQNASVLIQSIQQNKKDEPSDTGYFVTWNFMSFYC